MKRWDTSIQETGNKYVLCMKPNPDEMSKFVIDASQKLTHQIMEAEEKLVLQCISKAGLERMIKLCSDELKRRKKK